MKVVWTKLHLHIICLMHIMLINDKAYSTLNGRKKCLKSLAQKLKSKRIFGGPTPRYPDDIKIRI
jgi:hypothetical protein